MIKLSYKLSDDVKEGDVISSNIFRRRTKMFYNIKNFYAQSSNNGIFAENILRLTLDGVNLNHLSKNHPHVDLAIVNPIEGISKKNEIISVKSSISKKPTLSSVLRDTKSIKLESMFSYILFANSNYELNYERDYFNSKSLLKSGIDLIKKTVTRSNSDLIERVGFNKDFKAVVNTTIYYLLFKNKEEEKDNYIEDIIKISNNDYNLKHGNYSSYRINVLRRIVHLDSPISLGAIYMKEEDGLTCYIKKTNPIPLNRYWEDLVNIWLDEEFFESDKVKYLDLNLVKELFGISGGDFPIEIKISLSDFNPDVTDTSSLSDREKIEMSKGRAEKRTNKLYVATKFKDADFGDKDAEVNKFFLKSIDLLEKDPNVITKFNQFTSSIENPPKLNKWW